MGMIGALATEANGDPARAWISGRFQNMSLCRQGDKRHMSGISSDIRSCYIAAKS
jgi:hypothetical protein